MSNCKIIVPVDFTAASDKAVAVACSLAKSSGCSVSLIHVLNKELSERTEKEISNIKTKLDNLRIQHRLKEDNSEALVLNGSIFDEIPTFSNRTGSEMIVIGTHGIKGFRQKLLGADILKIARKVPVPCLIVSEESPIVLNGPIVFPVGGHQEFVKLVDATALLAGWFNAEVHIYSVTRPGEELSNEIQSNIKTTTEIFTQKKIAFSRVKEDASVVSVGFARQTLQYADSVNAGLISIMSVKSEEHFYFAQADKETMINNPYQIPVLCSSGIGNF